MMEKAARVIKVILVAAILAALFLFLYRKLSGLFTTLLVSVVLAYLLNKPLVWLSGRMKRRRALAVLFVTTAGAAVFFCYVVIPLFFRQATDLLSYIPHWIQSAGALLYDVGESAGEPIKGILDGAYAEFNGRAAQWLGSATISLAQGSYAKLGWLLLLPVFTFYLLKDHAYFTDQLGYLIPLRHRHDLHLLYGSIDKAVGQFLRGQLLVSFTVALLSAAGLLAVGVPNALLLGFLCGLFNLVPYIGPFIGALTVALVSVMLGWKAMLLAVAVIFAVQQIDNLIISPKVLGDSIRIHPVYVLVAIFAGSGLFGLLGLLLALPALIVIKEVVLFLFKKRLYGERGRENAV